MSLELVNQIKQVHWGQQSENPFVTKEFFSALERSNVIGRDSGWDPLYFTGAEDGALFSFIKTHSYGEYIFDWQWASAYQEHGIPYYPKLTSMIPFTSVSEQTFYEGGFPSTDGRLRGILSW